MKKIFIGQMPRNLFILPVYKCVFSKIKVHDTITPTASFNYLSKHLNYLDSDFYNYSLIFLEYFCIKFNDVTKF